MNEENITKQTEEIETLSAIYMDDFKWLDEGCFSVSIKEDLLQFILIIYLNNDYPHKAPPNYSIETSDLEVKKRLQLDADLMSIYSENLGEPIIFDWITAIKDFLYKVHSSQAEDKEEEEEEESGADDKEEKKEVNKREEDVESIEKKVEDYSYHDEYNKSDKPSKQDNSAEELPAIYHSEHLKDRKSDFQGHLAPVFSKAQVDMVMASLKENKKIAAATHNILAYRIELGNGHYNSGCVDDGEFGASARMLNLLNIIDARNVMVVVTRWYGGIHLGPDRFKHINNITRDLLDEYGYIKIKANAKKFQKPSTENNPKMNKKNLKKRWIIIVMFKWLIVLFWLL